MSITEIILAVNTQRFDGLRPGGLTTFGPSVRAAGRLKGQRRKKPGFPEETGFPDWVNTGRSAGEQQVGLLDQPLNVLQEACGRRAVDDAVIEHQAERHHLA